MLYLNKPWDARNRPGKDPCFLFKTGVTKLVLKSKEFINSQEVKKNEFKMTFQNTNLKKSILS